MTNVSRETLILQAYPAAAAKLQKFHDLLAVEGPIRGLIGPKEVEKLWDRHIGNSLVLEELLPEGCSLIDVGTGAGLPGIPIAIVRPDLEVHLVEPMQRRIDFLELAVSELDLSNTQIHRARAEQLHGQLVADLVTARAVASVKELIEWCEPLLNPHGRLVLLKGEKAEIELKEAKPSMHKHGLVLDDIVLLGEGLLFEPTRAVVLIRK
ncbi:MAG: 16S rRNA (guanine(527)-N(7))-methyltransferase RsmG [Candidatus Nanopelagicales bacterium]